MGFRPPRRLRSGGSSWWWTRAPDPIRPCSPRPRPPSKAAGSEAQLRVPRTATEQLSVTHYFAAQGYRTVVGVGLDRDVAVAPVASKYPNTRFVAAEPGQVARALQD